MYLISACLAGINCKYNGRNNLEPKIVKLIEEKKAILVCPEQLGGLTTPRLPSEIIYDENGNRKVVNIEGKDLTKEFLKGAEETLKIAKLTGAKEAILKAKSPSCGKGKIYDGQFKKILVEGNGITTDLLEKYGIKVYTEEDDIENLK
ncbi:DUF523 domain-containing protein [Proteiniborus sp. MB09-C3]|uniref:DUF523 domain-containing protein n=1 Tax=Proteiniborus sp. MB09-C3 TaxID=3050072 RepID=UPI002556B52D|nr:DUF523 domain-containing protein [Proteiniborus sp. MB09-C3]WIV11397.1 DUF523 domain-containing protein [Proteiniborus sp. MB09-C3]